MRPILRVDLYICQTCSTCQARAVCRTRAIVQYERGDLPVIDHTRCRAVWCVFPHVRLAPCAALIPATAS